MKGICGRLLEVDLTSGVTKDHDLSEDAVQQVSWWQRTGRTSALLTCFPPKQIRLSPENLLFFLTGPLTGTKVPGSSKFVVVTKSPLTGGWCDSYSSGKLPGELKKLGYDGMVIRGKSSSPCYLRIDNQGVRIKEAGWLWGKDSFETDRLIKEAEKEPSAGVSSIGPAGEKLCRFACINSELYRQAGRGGVGAVMGSKNLKAIVIKGKGHVEQHDRTRLVELNQSSFQRSRRSRVAQARMKYGTPLTLNITHSGGILPTRNFQFGTWNSRFGQDRFGRRPREDDLS